MLSAPDTQDNPQEAFHTPPEQPSLHSSDVNAVPPSAGSHVLDDPSDDSEFLDEIKWFSEKLPVKKMKLGFGEDFPHSAGSQVFLDSSEMELLDADIDNFGLECSEVLPVKKLKLGFEEDSVPVNDDDSFRDIPMDKNSVPEENAVNDYDDFCREIERFLRQGSGNVNLVNGHNHNRSSVEVGEVADLHCGSVLDLVPDSIRSRLEKVVASGLYEGIESFAIFEVLKALKKKLTLLETAKHSGFAFPEI